MGNYLEKQRTLEHNILQQIEQLYKSWCAEPPTHIQKMPASGSDRQYYRVSSASKHAIAAYNTHQQENQTFIDYTNHFEQKGVAVPTIYAQDLEANLYLQQDLGNQTLLHCLEQQRGAEIALPLVVRNHYEQALAKLAYLQTKGSEGLAVEKHHKPAAFNQQNMLWDLNYFKYCFLKPSKVQFEEQLLEQDFQTLADYLDEECDYFMFRDFQARNIMLLQDEVYFIDYQGGKKGPLQYDVVSLLFQAKANLQPQEREDLLDYYMTQVSQYITIDVTAFRSKYYAFVLLRTLQVLGAYGYKGYFEQKKHFLESIPYALQNLKWLLQEIQFEVQVPHLMIYLTEMVEYGLEQQHKKEMKADRLTVRVQSFSYKNGIPPDPSGNGGGFVFDCRFLHNPGRYQPYKKLTGRDVPVIEFLQKDSTIDAFIAQIKPVLAEAIENYIDRGFASLCINFGCTGGQHRSVYSADAIAKFIQDNYSVNLLLHHREQERKNWRN